MNDPIDIVSLILIIIFAIYEFWAFRNNKPLNRKLLPVIFMFVLSLFIVALAFLTGIAKYYIISVLLILIIELSLKGILLVVLAELCSALFGADRNLKKVIILALVFIVLAAAYYLGERAF